MTDVPDSRTNRVAIVAARLDVPTGLVEAIVDAWEGLAVEVGWEPRHRGPQIELTGEAKGDRFSGPAGKGL